MIRVDTHTGHWRSNGAGDDAFGLLAAGDICPAEGYRLNETFSAGLEAARATCADALPELADKDLSVANLELPLAGGGEPILKDGPCLHGPPTAFDAVLACGFDAVDMANNHVMDFGPGPLRETVNLARSRGVAVFGVGETAGEAACPLFIERAGRRIGLLAFAENEFGCATRTTPGASPLHPGPSAALIARTREQCDLLAVFVHGGNEYCPFPSPRMVRDYRSFAEAGADAVIGHHAHTVQGMELHNGVPIVYNLGNFLFWAAKDEHAAWWQQMLVRLRFAGRRCTGLDVIPCRLDGEPPRLTLLAGQRKQAFLERLNRLSEIIADADLHERFWHAYCLGRLSFFLARIKETRDGMDIPHLRPLAAAHLKNLFSCEAHHEAIITGLELVRCGQEGVHFGVEEELARLMRPG